MKIIENFDDSPPFEVIRPAAHEIPFVFNSPHSGHDYPEAFLEASRLCENTIRRSEDSFVDELFAAAIARGAPMLRARFPRAYLDVNREPYELDPAMIDGELPRYANSRSPRVASGLGTIARIVAERQEIYIDRLPLADAMRRIEMLYKPYHAALRRILAETHVRFGHAVLIDCHSMPSVVRGQDRWRRPDFVIGDRFGTSCSDIVSDTAARVLRSLGYSVARNKPYAGGFITEHYGRPAQGLHALQVEVNRALYMDERTYERAAGWGRLERDIATFVDAMADVDLGGFVPQSQAAE
ncbi:N-formylglutamate amidohydrolase [Rhodobium orientis]|uniref:N-formylglutamate amidohydrolase n=1 Tax=Rhodobium orientis TaxID=34017 RepID=A0A327JL60_9HYPH|nr:N-formylglutamate amidohydrolase [Rhodobium orientis]MBB4302916.1 N-formylglutamate amidohydrolase [Rhodobium orientis]MBK5949477.1 N-formylglutamate amidohydrolase [Rhodobium orientis]RAI26043.1 N-formylglutamate amidohydrolase [Rhodobium orientis]